MKFDILVQPSTAPPPPICSQVRERAKLDPPEVRCLQFRRRAKFGPLWVAQAAAFLPSHPALFKFEFSLGVFSAYDFNVSYFSSSPSDRLILPRQLGKNVKLHREFMATSTVHNVVSLKYTL